MSSILQWHLRFHIFQDPLLLRCVPKLLCCDLQGSHGQLLRHSLSGLPEGGPTLDAATLPLPVRQAAFVEAADCFAALIAKPEVSVACPPTFACMPLQTSHTSYVSDMRNA